MKPAKTPTHFGRPTLKERGWTDALIDSFLGEPDLLRPNPHYRSAPPRKLYLISRVEAVEATEQFRSALVSAASRKKAAKSAVATKLKRIREHAEGVRFEVPTVARDDLIRMACDHYNNRQMDRAERRGWDDYRLATPDSAPGFLERICTNFLRHRMTAYDDRLDEVSGRVGVRVAYAAFVAKVLDAIAAAYPWLAAECGRQKAVRVTARGED